MISITSFKNNCFRVSGYIILASGIYFTLVCAGSLTPSFANAQQINESATNKKGVKDTQTQSARETQLLLLSQEDLARAKHNPDFSEQIDAIINDGESALDKGPYSVTFNNLVPASNNTNDYFSVGPYWWPDSNKKNGLPWIRRDGEVNKAVRAADSDSKQLLRVIETINKLGLAYYFSSDERYSERAEKLLNVFFIDAKTKMNPHLNFAQSIPGKTHGRGIGIIEARQIVRVLDGMTLMQHALSPRVRVSMDEWLTIFLGWLIESPNGQDEMKMYNNHGSYYDVIITSLALYLDMPDIAKYAIQNTKVRIKTQINEVGEQAHELKRTRPFHYSVFNLMAMINMASMAEKLGIDLWQYPDGNDPRILKAWQLLASHIGDERYWDGKQEKNVEYNRLIGPTLMLRAMLIRDNAVHNAYEDSTNSITAFMPSNEDLNGILQQTVARDTSRSLAQIDSCSVLFYFNAHHIAKQNKSETPKYKSCVY